MPSAWICTRNDVLGNIAVLLAAAGVFGTGTGWPDVIVASIMAALAIQGAALSSNKLVVNCALAVYQVPERCGDPSNDSGRSSVSLYLTAQARAGHEQSVGFATGLIIPIR